MKRTFTSLILLACIIAAWGQNAAFYWRGVPLADGDVVTIAAEADAVFGDIQCATNPAGSGADGLVLRNLRTADIPGQATLTIRSNTMATSNITWCMGSDCVPVNTTTYSKAFSLPASGYVMLQFDATPTQYGALDATLSVDLGSEQLSVGIRFVYRERYFERRVVMEEFTGTWCGNCPRGIVAIERLCADFADRFIPIAVHSGSGEPMQIATYPELVPGDGGVPSCMLNRGQKLDPYSGSRTKGAYHYGIDADVRALLAQPAEADVQLDASWNDEYQWDIRLTTTTTFADPAQADDYRLAFVLLEDSLTGEGKPWAQVNYFSTAGGYDDSRNYLDDDMKPWRDAAYNVYPYAYNHVAVNSLGIKTGVTGSIEAIEAGKPQRYTTTITTINQRVIQEKSRLTAVALLLNAKTGRIVNAARADIRPYGDAAGIKGIYDSPTDDLPTYNLGGQRIVGSSAKGVYVRNGKKFIR